LSQEQVEILVCREMGWSHADYLATPYHIIKSILVMLREETEQIKRINKTT